MFDRTIMHIDMDAFFASVEQRDHPWLEGKPVIVGGEPEGRGVVSSASYEARKFGIKAGMSLKIALNLCPQAILVRGDREKYSHISSHLMEIFADFTPLVEPISIDEAFLDLTGCERLLGSPVEVARQIKGRISQELDLTASIGIGPNKLLAKLASSLCKPDGLMFIRPSEVAQILEGLPLSKMGGIGEKTEEELSHLGIRTVGELARYPEELLRRRFGKWGTALYRMAHGLDDSPVLPPEAWPPEKSMGHEHTFREDTRDWEVICASLLALSDRVARRLRQRGLLGRTITLKLRYADFTTLTRRETFGEPTDDEITIYSVAKTLLSGINLGRRKIRLVGVNVSNLIPGQGQQLGLFSSDADEKRKKASRAVDRIRRKYGEKAIGRGTALASTQSL